MSLIPTTTGSAKAITAIFPELEGKLNGHAVRVPLANASLTDMVFELEHEVTVEEVNTALEQAAKGPLAGILGYEERLWSPSIIVPTHVARSLTRHRPWW